MFFVSWPSTSITAGKTSRLIIRAVVTCRATPVAVTPQQGGRGTRGTALRFRYNTSYFHVEMSENGSFVWVVFFLLELYQMFCVHGAFHLVARYLIHQSTRYNFLRNTGKTT